MSCRSIHPRRERRGRGSGLRRDPRPRRRRRWRPGRGGRRQSGRPGSGAARRGRRRGALRARPRRRIPDRGREPPCGARHPGGSRHRRRDGRGDRHRVALLPRTGTRRLGRGGYPGRPVHTEPRRARHRPQGLGADQPRRNARRPARRELLLSRTRKLTPDHSRTRRVAGARARIGSGIGRRLHDESGSRPERGSDGRRPDRGHPRARDTPLRRFGGRWGRQYRGWTSAARDPGSPGHRHPDVEGRHRCRRTQRRGPRRRRGRTNCATPQRALPEDAGLRHPGPRLHRRASPARRGGRG